MRAGVSAGRAVQSRSCLSTAASTSGSAVRSSLARCGGLRGDVDEELAAAAHRLSGTFTSGGQEQFYLESQAAIAYPGEQGQMLVHSSTQHPTEIQGLVAEMLGVGQHEVVCICKRMGGAFGGKESQAAIPAMMAALVAHKTGRSARVVYNKDLHLHARDPKDGRPSPSPELFMQFLPQIKQRCNAIVNITTGGGQEYLTGRASGGRSARFPGIMTSLNMGSMESRPRTRRLSATS